MPHTGAVRPELGPTCCSEIHSTRSTRGGGCRPSAGGKLAAQRLKVGTFVRHPASPLSFPCSHLVVSPPVISFEPEVDSRSVLRVSGAAVAGKVLENKFDGHHLILRSTLIDTLRR